MPTCYALPTLTPTCYTLSTLPSTAPQALLPVLGVWARCIAVVLAVMWCFPLCGHGHVCHPADTHYYTSCWWGVGLLYCSHAVCAPCRVWKKGGPAHRR